MWILLATFTLTAHAIGPLAVIGDTQVTTWPERLMGREYNSDVTPQILQFLAAEKPAVFLHLGDSVTCGGCPSWMPEWFLPGWDFYARASAPVRALGIPQYLATGNHEHWGRDAWMQKGIQEHFPEMQNFPIVLRYQHLAIAVLDSNHPADQRSWLETQLAALSKDSQVKMIALATHHPPFSNSKVVGGHRASRAAFLDLFEKTPKARLWLSGHAHGYEHFVIGTKHFVVSAGGGGARQPQAETREHEDQFKGPFPRPFNYLLISETPVGFEVVTRGWNRGEPGPSTIDTLALNQER